LSVRPPSTGGRDVGFLQVPWIGNPRSAHVRCSVRGRSRWRKFAENAVGCTRLCTRGCGGELARGLNFVRRRFGLASATRPKRSLQNRATTKRETRTCSPARSSTISPNDAPFSRNSLTTSANGTRTFWLRALAGATNSAATLLSRCTASETLIGWFIEAAS
jgi:hypothetical protein